MREHLKYQYLPALVALVIVAAGLTLWNIGAKVIWFDKAELVSSKLGQVKMKVTAHKPRDCKFVAGSEVGYIRVEGNWQESYFIFLNDTTPGNSKPQMLDRISFGTWEWDDAEPPLSIIESVMATVAHDCGNERLRTTKIGPFKVT